MRKGDPQKGTFEELGRSVTIDGKTWVYDSENRIETTFAADSGTYATTRYFISFIEDVFLQQGIEVVAPHSAQDLRETAGNLFSVLF